MAPEARPDRPTITMETHRNRIRRRLFSSRHGRRRSRGVSDMVATILIVAITVVLAAVLYIMISGLTRSTGTDPLGTAFAWGAPTNLTGTSTFGCPSVLHYCYRVEIAWTGSSLLVTSVHLGLQNSAGSTVAWPASVTATGGAIRLISPTSAVVAANYWTTNSTWQLVAPFTGTLAAGSSIVIYCGGAAEGAGQGLAGLEVVAVGASGYSGTVPAGSFS